MILKRNLIFIKIKIDKIKINQNDTQIKTIGILEDFATSKCKKINNHEFIFNNFDFKKKKIILFNNLYKKFINFIF